MIRHWIDSTGTLAYLVVRGQVVRFRDFLDHVEALIRQPDWTPGTPILEDLREFSGGAPPNCVREWREFVVVNHERIAGCHWAVIVAERQPDLLRVLELAAQDASPYGVVLRPFTDSLHAHAWAASVGGAH